MAYTLKQIKSAAYAGDDLIDPTIDEKNMWKYLRYCYDLFRGGEEKDLCEYMMQSFIAQFWRGEME